MVIAVTFDKETGKIGKHFGHADFFKLYEVEDGKIIDSAVVAPFGQGHDAVVATMMDYSVALVICDNIGEGALQGLAEAGIAVCPQVTMDPDEAVAAFFAGELPIQTAADGSCQEGHRCCDAAEGCGSGCCSSCQ